MYILQKPQVICFHCKEEFEMKIYPKTLDWTIGLCKGWSRNKTQEQNVDGVE